MDIINDMSIFNNDKYSCLGNVNVFVWYKNLKSLLDSKTKSGWTEKTYPSSLSF